MAAQDASARSRTAGHSATRPIVALVPIPAASEVIGPSSWPRPPNAFSEADVRLLSTLAASLGVALENVRSSARRASGTPSWRSSTTSARHSRRSSTSTRSSSWSATQMRATFEADIVYVALHDAATDRIEFPYYYEDGKRGTQDAIALRPGPDVADPQPREPLLLNRDDALRGDRDARRRHAGAVVPRRADPRRGRAIGVDQRPEHQQTGRFSEADTRLLSTIAANVGVAIQNARLFQEAQRRADEMAALAEVGREISATLELEPVLERIAERAHATCSTADTCAAVPRGRRRRHVSGDRRASASWPTRSGRTRSVEGEGIIGDVARRGRAEFVNDADADPRAVDDPGHRRGRARASGSWPRR